MKPLGAILKIVIFSLFFSGPGASAHSPNDTTDSNIRSLGPLVAGSSLIVYGEVVDIQYRNSEPTKEQPHGLPHTFVSYKIQEVLRGKPLDDLLTLRIPGGADGRGGVYSETSSPTFARGQTDVLFVQGGRIEGCQLVDCIEGRYRVHENQVFNGWGVPVVEASKRLVIGGRPRFELNVMEVPRPSFDELLLNPDVEQRIKKVMKRRSLSLDELREVYDQEAPKFSTIKYGFEDKPTSKDVAKGPIAEVMEEFGKPLTPAAFFDAVRNWSEQFGKPGRTVVMANPRKRFKVADPQLGIMNVEKIRSEEVNEEQSKDKQAMEGDKQ